ASCPFSRTAPAWSSKLVQPRAGAQVKTDLPTDLPPLAVTGEGDVWVVSNGSADRWTVSGARGESGCAYQDAVFAPDGSLLALRSDGRSLTLERLLRPGRRDRL